MNQQKDELLKRIQKLVKQNQDLIGKNENLQRAIDELTAENEALKRQPGRELRSDEGGGEQVITTKFKMATVLFANIEGFYKLTDDIDSEVLMDQLDEVLIQFNSILKKYKIQKIKTIGDTFMAAGGIPLKNITNPVQVVLAALEMHSYLSGLTKSQEQKIWNMSLGIHTGPVTANITGKKKVTYDIKGDTVNIAHRVQGVGESGKILVSVMTYELVKEFFVCEYFGKLPVKYKGDLEMFEVRGIRPEFSVSGEGLLPNDKFETKFKLIQFTDLQEIILDKLEKELPSYLYYHNVKHTVDVVTEVELIGWAEGLDDEDILILKTAGLFHDAGHTINYDEHEYHGTLIVKEYLPKYGYTQKEIERICEVIMATKMPPKPNDLLQKIICDADLDYLGRSDMIPVSNTLYKELKEQNKIGTLNDWNKLQVKFITGHQYFTNTAQSLREVNKQKQIERIKELIEE